MKKIILLAILILVIGCSSKLGIRNIEFAVMQANSELVPHDSTYNVGDTVYLVLEDVGSFEKDDDNKIKVDIDMTVTDKNATVLLNKTNMLGAAGHIQINSTTLEFPYVNVETASLAAGNYDIFVTIKDFISNRSASTSAQFTLQ